ncbi:hypothetical protein C8F04DRAFT_1267315 [Mycena alexandri]|uniref:Uncharacterized protein n=1 Tax=Mycena alexandri TaxID=1745969 RepID=A0AAD6SHZ1_9AGAR|nr:hypothetical protein C8F04DRAFT_1267315 [Mycena alexandri]
MAATMTTMPPTTYALPHAQRAHLIRSTRKLGDLLGETPLLVESSAGAQTLFSRSHSRSSSTMSTESRRSARIFMSSPRTSSLGLTAVPAFPDATVHAEASPAATAISRPMLFLRLPPAGSAPSPAAAERTTPLPSPLSPTFGLALNSPGTPPPTLDTSRRRKMAKLMRTLGENVPPELVFPTAAAGLTPKARRRASTLSVPESMRERHLAHKQSAASIAVEEEPDAPFSYPSTVPVQYVTEPARRSMDTSSDSSSEYLLPNPHEGDKYMHRREQGWSGEWGGNVSNMEDVVRSLRGLKTK